jgi:site-specific DNA-methyltransferase (adenine-specific)
MMRADGWYLRKTIIWDKGTATEPPRLERPSVSHSYVFLLAKSERAHTRDPGEGWWQRSVWTIPPGYHGTDHPAPMAVELARRCILAGCPTGGTVLDPFGGAGTTALVADRHGRNAILIELNPEYAAMAERRIRGDAGLFAEVEAA